MRSVLRGIIGESRNDTKRVFFRGSDVVRHRTKSDRSMVARCTLILVYSLQNVHPKYRAARRNPFYRLARYSRCIARADLTKSLFGNFVDLSGTDSLAFSIFFFFPPINFVKVLEPTNADTLRKRFYITFIFRLYHRNFALKIFLLF